MTLENIKFIHDDIIDINVLREKINEIIQVTNVFIQEHNYVEENEI